MLLARQYKCIAVHTNSRGTNTEKALGDQVHRELPTDTFQSTHNRNSALCRVSNDLPSVFSDTRQKTSLSRAKQKNHCGGTARIIPT
jgi:hypothetical protein